ncbi:hypothetical protein [Bradyrhizobium yuanmingense]|uniref:hypothetical protein n=1 Tax=Bradyrhizobium yuanmingense TaxID=108015 RepID=UPI0023B98BF9|nr:hypothetical protein [Bradyrhizobium yuanmingense]MDF0584736.1 hypothetical protein [Bradyrhizobium yuanmingense]
MPRHFGLKATSVAGPSAFTGASSATPDRTIGVCIEEPFSAQFSSVKALFPMLGAAILACELAGLPHSTVHLSKLKIHATGGNAKKPDMQAAAKERWGKDLGEDEADAAWAGAYALDSDLFGVETR